MARWHWRTDPVTKIGPNEARPDIFHPVTRHVVVIGAGIVGVSTAIWLRRLGAEVTVVDRAGPGAGTSHGNAGILASCSVVPVTTPGLIRRAPAMLLNPEAPLFMRWSYFPKLIPWLARYLSHTTDDETRRIAAGLGGIIGDSVDQHLALTEGMRARDFVALGDYNFAYADRAAFEADAYVWDIRAQAGFVPDLLEGREVRDYEPAFGPAIGCIARMKDHGHVLDPGGYVRALAADLQDMGGRIVTATVQDVDLEGGRIRSVLTDEGPIACDAAVLATGVWSKPLMKKLGISVPLESERGYHIVFRNAEGGPRAPAMIASGKFVATPMKDGLRCAGIVEFGGLDAGPSEAPFALLRKQAKTAFPGLTCVEEIKWQGHRPAPSDSLPLIGEVRDTGVFAAFGHHHIGLTGGPKTGRIVAGLITGTPTNLDLSPYAPGRFAR